MRRRLIAVVAMAALVLPLAGCVDLFLPPNPRPTSTPTGEEVAPELASFYEQQLVWERCGTGSQCVTAVAPLDWSDPQRATIDLALVRQAATGGDPIGSLLVNPGGPGGSGVSLIRDSVDFAVSDAVQEVYDVVGFDPRGVGASSAVRCYDDPAEFDAFLFDLVPGERGSDAWLDDYERTNADFAARCAELTGELIGYVDTVSAARDLDLLRAILGDDTLNYLGYSYGSKLGAVYAELYPAKTGRLVFDGALDPLASSFEVSLTQAEGFEAALRSFLEDCLTQSDCPYDGTVDAAMGEVRDLLDRLDVSPLAAEDGRQLGSSAMFTAIIYPLYSQSSWSALRAVLTEVQRGSAEYAFQLADSYYGRSATGEYSKNSTEAFLAVNCLDYVTDTDRTAMREEEAELQARAPVLGPQLAYGGSTCAGWPVDPVGSLAAVTGAGASDILVVGTTNDPATPYRWAVTLAGQLEKGHLVTFDGDGHTAYNKGSSCVDTVVDAYLVDGTVPTSDPRC